jgi:hypothetical protein
MSEEYNILTSKVVFYPRVRTYNAGLSFALLLFLLLLLFLFLFLLLLLLFLLLLLLGTH